MHHRINGGTICGNGGTIRRNGSAGRRAWRRSGQRARRVGVTRCVQILEDTRMPANVGPDEGAERRGAALPVEAEVREGGFRHDELEARLPFLTSVGCSDNM